MKKNFSSPLKSLRKKTGFSILLKSFRKESGLSQSKFSKKIGVKIQTFQSWESGRFVPNKFSQSEILRRISNIKD